MGYTLGQLRKRQEITTLFPTTRVPAALNGDESILIVASESYSGTHSIQVFHKRNGVYEWVSTTDMTDLIGSNSIDCLALSPDGDKFACGLSTWSSSKGMVTLFLLDGDGVITADYPDSIIASDGASFEEYAWNVHWSSTGTRLFVTASYHSYHYGTVYVYEIDGSAWDEVQQITGATYDDDLAWGLSTSADDTLLAVGSWNSRYDHYGKVHIYELDQNGLYQLRDTISPPSEVSEARFGTGVALSLDGTYLFVGWPGYPTSSQGSIKTYHYNGSTWSLVSTAVKESPVNSQYFGNVLVRAHETNTLLIGHKSAISIYQPYVYSLSGTVVDDNEDPAERTIYLVDSDIGELINTGVSDSVTGEFSFGVVSNNEHIAICCDDMAGVNYNALIFSGLIPE